jgi:hypothetical protein
MKRLLLLLILAFPTYAFAQSYYPTQEYTTVAPRGVTLVMQEKYKVFTDARGNTVYVLGFMVKEWGTFIRLAVSHDTWVNANFGDEYWMP